MTRETLAKSDRPLAVPVRAVSVEVLLADGSRMTGRIFLRGAEPGKGQETIQGRLNDPERFFPFERGERVGAQGPWNRARLVDYLNDAAGAFFPLEAEGRTWYVNRDLVQLVVNLGTNGQAR